MSADKERRDLNLPEQAIDPFLVARMGREALKDGISVRRGVISKWMCEIAFDELTKGKSPADPHPLERVAEDILNRTLAARQNLSMPLVERAFEFDTEIPRWGSPVAATIIENMHQGLERVVDQERLSGLALSAEVAIYKKPTSLSLLGNRPLAIKPHRDDTFQYLHAALTIQGSADFYYSLYGGHPHMTKTGYVNEFNQEPETLALEPGTLVVMRGVNVDGMGVDSALYHAVGTPKPVPGTRMSLLTAYVKQ